MKRGGRLPQQRSTPRRKVHPVQPPWPDPGPDPVSSAPDAQICPETPTGRRYGGLPRQRATERRDRHPVRPFGETEPSPEPPAGDDFRVRVLDATSPRGRCAGTPGCPVDGPHEGHHAHHIHPRGRGGTDHTLNGAWLCSTGHAWVHGHPAAAIALGLLASWSPPWPDPDYVGT